MIVLSIYDELVNYTYNNMEDTSSYQELLDKLKKYIMIENNEYNKVDVNIVNEYFNELDGDSINTPIDERMFNKLTYRHNILSDYPMLEDGTLLNNVIDSKILIDALKLVDTKIRNVSDEDEPIIEDLINYHRNSKYTYLSSNNYLELLSLNYNFDINKIPTIDFNTVQEMFNINFIDVSQSIFYNYIMDGINYLANINMKDKILETYLSLMELSRIEVLLKYLNKDILNLIINDYNKYYKNNKDNAALVNVKRLVIKRKEEL